MDINSALVASTFTTMRCPNSECGKYFLPAPRCPYCGQKVETAEQRTKNLKERVEMVRAMEYICRQINDEDVFEGWLMCGVADGDIDEATTNEEIIELGYTDDTTFVDLMDCFLRRMLGANRSGGLFCGGVTSTIGEERE